MIFAIVIATSGAAAQTVPSTGGFDRAIERASARAVKLYGLGAGAQEGYGTGVLVSADGLVLTVQSLLLDADTVRAVTSDGTRHEAAVVHRDPVRQLALLKLVPAGDARRARRDGEPEPTASFDYYDVCHEVDLRPGDWILAAGNPFKVADGVEPVSVAHGVFSTRTPLDAQRRLKDFPYRGDVLVIDAITSNPGSPGSALVNLDGDFVGLVGRVVFSNLTNTHFNYAMPRDVICGFFREANVNPQPKPAVDHRKPPEVAMADRFDSTDLGLRMSRTGYQTILPFVERVRADSPAAKAGVRKDDLVLSVNGKAVQNLAEFDDRISELKPGETVTLVIRRGRVIVDLLLEPSGT